MIPRLVLLVAVVAGCSAPPAATPSASPSPTIAVTSPTPTLSPTAAPTASSTPIPLPSFAQISAPAGSVVWAMVAGTRLFRSTDRGDTWQERPLPPQPINVLLSFVDEQQGWLAMTGSPGTQCQSQSISISHTADAAATWRALNATGITATQCKNSISFVGATHGFVMAYDPNTPPVIYRTADGGQSWMPSRPLSDPPGYTTRAGGALVAVAVRGFAATLLADVAGQNSRYAFRSSDGGATWTYVSTAPNQLDQLVFVTATRWLQIGAPGDSKETTDAGASWHLFTTDYQQAAPIAPAITFGDAQVGYATVRGAIQRTIDGGAHWTSIRTPGTF